MLLGIGLDLCQVSRMEKALEREGFLTRFFTEGEQAYLRARGKGMAQSAAGCFAAKEAALKALGCGILLPLRDVGVEHDESGAPRYLLAGEAEKRMRALGGARMLLSITHEGDMAAAVAVLEGEA